MTRIVRVLFWLLGRLPLPAAHAVSVVVGTAAWLCSPALRRRIAENLRIADLPADPPRVRAVLCETVKSGVELAIAWTRSPRYIVSLFREVHGWEHVERAMAQKHGLLLITPHLGSYDLAGRMISENLPFPLTAMYRPPKKAWLEPIMTAGRERGKGHAAPADAHGVRLVVRALRRREAVIVLPDQVPKAGEGVLVPFFGKPAYTMTLAARLAAMKDVDTFLFVGARLPRGRGFDLFIMPLSGCPEGERETDAALINRNVEDLIRRFPEQYLFSYNRYKMP